MAITNFEGHLSLPAGRRQAGDWHQNRPWLCWLCLISAVLLILSFPTPNLWILAWVGLVPLLLAIRNKTPKKAFLLSYLTGIIFFSGILYWLCYVTVTGFVFLVFYLGLYFGLFGVFSNLIFSGRLPVLIKTLIISCLWVSLEFIRSNLFTGFGWALLGYSQWLNHSIIQIAEITGAYGISFLIVMVNVVIAEGFGDSAHLKMFFQGPLNGRCPRASVRQDRPSKLGTATTFAITLVTLGLVILYGFWKIQLPLQGRQIKISVIQGNIPQEKKWDEGFRPQIFARYSRLTRLAALQKPDLIVWPETSVPGYLEEEPFFVRELSDLTKQTGTPLLVGAPRLHRATENLLLQPSPQRGEGTSRGIPSPLLGEGATKSSPSPPWGEGEGEGEFEPATLLNQERHYNSAILFSESGQIIGYYDKLRLVPFGEYLPEWFPAPLSLLLPPQASLIANFSAGFEPTIFNLPEGKFGVLICFEDTFPELMRNFVKNGAEFMLNITNDAWFGKSSAPYQHAQASVFRAVENRIPIIRCANTGLSVFIDTSGRILARVSDQKGRDIFITGYQTKDVVLASSTLDPPRPITPTIYTRYGDIFAFLCILVLIFGHLLNYNFSRKVASGVQKQI